MSAIRLPCQPAVASTIVGQQLRARVPHPRCSNTKAFSVPHRRLMLSDSLEPFSRPWPRQRGSRLRVADLRRPVADASDPSDVELDLAARLAPSSTSSISSSGQPVDISAVVEQQVTRQRLLDALHSSASTSGQEQGHGAAPGHYPSSSSHSSTAIHIAAAVAGDSQDPGSSSSSSGRPHPGHAIQQHADLETSTSGGANSHDQQEQQPLLHSRRPQQQQQQQLDDNNSSSSSSSGPAGGGAAAAGGEVVRGGIPHSIFVLSMVSMALTSASCVFNTLLPIYMVTELKMTMRSMGMFEGLLEAFSYVVRMFSGVLSDRMTSRKAAIAAGFTMGAAAKLGMSCAATVPQLFLGKAIDRLGNGVQAAPRDALIGDLSPAASRSACFGFAQSMRKWGSFMGAGLAFGLMKLSNNNYQAIFLLAAGVSMAATAAFLLFVPAHSRTPTPAGTGRSGSTAQAAGSSSKAGAEGFWGQLSALARDVSSMGRDFWRTLAVIAMYGLGHINESLLEARAIEVGFGKAESTLVVALLCFSIFLCAYPLGRLDDKAGHRTTFAVGMASLIAGDLVLCASGVWPGAVFAACLFWGVHWAVVQGPMLSVVVGLAPPHLKGTAFGIFYSVMAVTAMAANTMFGAVWTAAGATSAFALSAAIISVSLLLLPVLLPASASKGRGGAAAAPLLGKVAPA